MRIATIATHALIISPHINAIRCVSDDSSFGGRAAANPAAGCTAAGCAAAGRAAAGDRVAASASSALICCRCSASAFCTCSSALPDDS